MDHRTIVSFFTCQLVWVNRYVSETIQIQDTDEIAEAKWIDVSEYFAYSGAIRTPIPALPGQSFRDKPDTDSAINQPF